MLSSARWSSDSTCASPYRCSHGSWWKEGLPISWPAAASVGERSPPLADAGEEVLAFELERLVDLDVGDGDVAEAERDVLRERVVVGRVLGALVINLELFGALQVVEDDHPLVAHDGHRADLGRVEPA